MIALFIARAMVEGREQLNRRVYKKFKEKIQQYLDNLWEQEEKSNGFFIWTESDLQCYLYSCLTRDFSDSCSVNADPELTSIDPAKRYKGKAKSVKPFYQPDILITPKDNLKVEEEEWSHDTKHRRMQLKKKDNSIVLEIKFVQDTNSSRGRRSVSKLRELFRDYEKVLREGHQHMILVFYEKGQMSYLSETDIRRILGKSRKFTVFHQPKATILD